MDSVKCIKNRINVTFVLSLRFNEYDGNGKRGRRLHLVSSFDTFMGVGVGLP